LEVLLDAYHTRAGPWGTAYFPAAARAGGERLAAEIQAGLERVEERLGRARGRPLTAVLTPDRLEFARIYRALLGRRPERWVAGAAFPAWDLLLVRGDSLSYLKPPRERPRAVLEHELAHLVIHRRPETAVPRWFDEGLAMWASGQLLWPEDEAFLSGLARIGALHSLEALEREVPASHDLAAIAYQESLLLVEWIVLRFGPGAVGHLLDALERGEDFPRAFEARTGLSLRELEARFRLWLRGKRGLWEVIFQSVDLWTIASVLALLAIARGALRRRRRLREMEEAERGDPAPPT